MLAVAAVLLLVARSSVRSFELVASYLRGAGMALDVCEHLLKDAEKVGLCARRQARFAQALIITPPY